MGRRGQQQRSLSHCTLGLASSPSTHNLDDLFSLKHSFSLGTAVTVVHGCRGTLGSAQGEAHPVGRRDPRRLLHPGAPSLELAPRSPGAEFAEVVSSTAAGAVGCKGGRAAVECLAFVQRAVLIKIKGLFLYSGSPSNYVQLFHVACYRRVKQCRSALMLLCSLTSPGWWWPYCWGGPEHQ